MAASANKGGEAEIVSDNKLNWEKKKNLDREKRKVSNQIEKCEQEISRLEAEIASCDNKFAQPDLFPETVNSKAFFEQYKALKQSLDQEVLRWEELHGQLDALGD
jgi:ATP-binding cassette subfamily F protein 3